MIGKRWVCHTLQSEDEKEVTGGECPREVDGRASGVDSARGGRREAIVVCTCVGLPRCQSVTL